MFFLVVDGEEMIFQMIKRQMAETGLEVLGATGPEEASTLIDRYGKRISALAVTGVILRPMVNTCDLVREAREKLGSEVPIIAMSSDERTNRFLVEAGCSHQTTLKSKVAGIIKELISVSV